MEESFLYLSEKDVNEVVENYNIDVIECMRNVFIMRDNGTVLLPEKISQILNKDYQNRINTMTSTLFESNVSGLKWVSVFPSNKTKKLKNVDGMIILSEIETGNVICTMNGAKLTSMRTAAVGALAAVYLSKENSESIGFIGAGEEAKAHFIQIKKARPSINKCYISSRTKESATRFFEEFKLMYSDVEFIDCGNDFEKAVSSADIIVTAISSQEMVLKAKWIKNGALYIHVAGLEDEYDVARKCSKIVCDDWECVKHRTQTIVQMYNAGELTEKDIYGNIVDIIKGRKLGRENDDEIIYFNSVGMAMEDVYLANEVYNIAKENNIGTWLKK